LLEPRSSTPLNLLIILLKRQRNLHTPFVLQLRHAKQCRANHRDNDSREEAENTFPNVFGAGEVVFAEAVEGSDQTAADDQADCEPESDSGPDLLDEAFVDDLISLRTKSLLEESQENRYNDACFEAFAEADEEDCLMVSWMS